MLPSNHMSEAIELFILVMRAPGNASPVKLPPTFFLFRFRPPIFKLFSKTLKRKKERRRNEAKNK